MLLKHILVFKNALAFMLRNGVVENYNPGVKYLLETLKLLYKVSIMCLLHLLQVFPNFVGTFCSDKIFLF